MTGNLFPAKGNLFHVIGNEFPVTRRTKNTLCHRNNISLRWKYTSCDRLNSFYTPVKEIQIFYIFPVTRKFLPVRRIIFPLTANCILPIACCKLHHAFMFKLHVANCMLQIAFCKLHVANCMLQIACCKMHVAHCMLQIACCK